MKILITGAGGFIGRNLFEFLSKKYKIYAPTKEELDLFNTDSVDKYLQKNKFDVIIHCASVACGRNIENPQNVMQGNLRMFFNIARNSEYFGKMIFVSSGAEYDRQKDIVKVKEEDSAVVFPEDELGFSKQICSKFAEQSKNIISLRVFGIFGKYEDYGIRFPSNAICRAICNMPITINQNRIFSYLYINDFCRIIDHIINKKLKHKIYNIVPDKTISLLEIAKKVKEILGKNLDIIVKSPGMGKEYTGSNARFKKELKNIKFTNIDDSLKELYDWYEENKKSINRKSLFFD